MSNRRIELVDEEEFVVLVNRISLLDSMSFDFSIIISEEIIPHALGSGGLDTSGNSLIRMDPLLGTFGDDFGALISGLVRCYPAVVDATGYTYTVAHIIEDGDDVEKLYKLSPSFQIVWSIPLWREFWHSAKSILIDSTRGHVVVIGSNHLTYDSTGYCNMYVLNTSDGSEVFKNYSVDDDTLTDLYSIDKDSSGYYYVGGVAKSAQFGSESTYAVWKIDPDNLYESIWGWTGGYNILTVSVHSTNGVAVGGISANLVILDYSGEVLLNVETLITTHMYGMKWHTDGNVLVARRYSFGASCGRMLSKYDSSTGDFIWSYSISGLTTSILNMAVNNTTGVIYVSGGG